MRLQFIICKVLQREAYLCAARSSNEIDIVVMPQGLHERPESLRQEVQKAVARTKDIEGRLYDASLLGYGLCSNGIVGLCSDIPLVVPRGHDCVTLLLGSKEKYKQYFDSHRGVYWYSHGWIESGKQPSRERFESTLKEYEKKYGPENTQFLMETEQGWMKEYSWATYIDWGFADSEREKEYTKQCARFLKWNYDEVKGDTSLMQRLLDGQWSEGEFLILKPGQTIMEDLTKDGLIKGH